ncbi:acyl-CoA dehydrogenase family protein [Kribbella shirazensis]|uniref:Acyl-CoA dehydrogenase n=1 Tax=Kribbella shirazensis TaxID=1105143 RepID=A0A7X5VHK7_9ACTN|nr:acyl-CoA dehydrogenase family protein [Kribbella shirazensis]NIK61440.1 acyl-CoA dehydrogenase [Kribbella shirazensis]
MNGNELDDLIAIVEKICSTHHDRRHGDGHLLDRSSWQALEESGFTLVSVPEDAGGPGGTMQQAAAVLRAAGRVGLAAPLAETMWLAGWLLASSGVPVPRGPLTAAVAEPGEVNIVEVNEGWQIDGVVRRVPWAGAADTVVMLVRRRSDLLVVRLHPSEISLRPGRNLAGEWREDVVCRKVVLDRDRVTTAGPDVSARGFLNRATLSRVLAMSGAAEEVLSVAMRHADEREQFGRPLAKFQAVQHLIAQLAGETASVVVAGQAATLALEQESGPQATFAIAAAKASASESAGRIAAWGHQILGAMGFTTEHALHRSTSRLWAWRDEFGNERHHRLSIGHQALSTDPWNLIVGQENGRAEADQGVS